MTDLRILPVVLSALVLASGCVPERDNPNDPANIPEPPRAPEADIDVLVEDQESQVGQRYSKWTLDAGASIPPAGETFDGACFDWALANETADDPLDLDPVAGWVVLTEGEIPCVEQDVFISTTANTALATTLHAVDDFDNGTAQSDGTGVTTRWVRLTIAKPDGGAATVYKPIAVVNTLPVVELGPDRRTAPGGRWWLSGDARRWDNVVVANVDLTQDPDPILDIRWTISGELATRLDLVNEFALATGLPNDGYVDTALLEPGSLRVVLPMSLDPSRSTLGVEIRDYVDPDGLIAPRASSDEMRVDVLTTLWAYSAQNGHLRRLDTSQFLGGFSQLDVIPLAYQNGSILSGRANDAVQLDLFLEGRGLQATPPTQSVATGTNSVDKIAAAPATGGGWWVQDGDAGKLYRFDATLSTFDTFTDVVTVTGGGAPLTFDFYAGASGDNAAIADGGAGRVWVIGGEKTSGTEGEKVLLVRADATPGVGNALVVPPVDPFGDNLDITEPRLLAPDGAGGVFVAPNSERRLTHVTINALDQVTPTPVVLPEACIELGHSILSMASDPARNALWIGVTTSEPDSDAVCRLDLSNPAVYASVPQKVDSAQSIAVHPDGSIFMIANGGEGLSRYAALDARSLEYIPLQGGLPGLSGVTAQDARFMENSLLVTVNQFAPVTRNRRAMVVEAAEIFEPNNIDLHVDPYVFDRVRHVSDPVTGTVWVWRPDDGIVASYAPSGEGPLQEIDMGYSERRGHLAYDPDAGRLWFMFSDLWVGNPTPDPATGRLLYVDVPEDRRSTPTLTEVVDVKIAMARGIAVVPSSGVQGGRLCLAADFYTEPIPEARVRVHGVDGTQTSEPEYLLNVGTDAEVWVTADPSSGECWAGREGAHTEYLRLLPGGTNSSPDTGRDLRHATMVAPGVAWAVSRDAGDSIVTLDLDSADQTIADPIFEANAVLPAAFGSVATGAFDPYWGHVWLGLDDANGNVVRATVNGWPHEAWRERGVNTPRLESGR